VNVTFDTTAIKHLQFDDPTVFNPDRWEKERSPGKFLAFSVGIAKCPGYNAGMHLLKVALMVLLRNFTFTFDPITMKEFERIPLAEFYKGKCMCNAEIKKREV